MCRFVCREIPKCWGVRLFAWNGEKSVLYSKVFFEMEGKVPGSML